MTGKTARLLLRYECIIEAGAPDMEPEYEQKGIFGFMGDVLGVTEPPAGAPVGADRQRAITQSAYQDSPYRDQFYEPGAANFAERLMYDYGYPGEYDPESNREVIDISLDGAQRHSRPADRQDLPTPQELVDARQHMLGTALAARGYGEGIAGFMGSVNENVFGFHQGRRDKAMDDRNNAVGLDLFRQAGIEATPQQLTQMVDDAIFRQLDRILARTPQERSGRRVSPGWEYNWRSPADGPDVYFPRNERGYFATQ